MPLKLIDEPEDEVGLFWPLVGFSWKPAKVSARERNWLTLLMFITVGFSMICSEVSELWRVPDVVLIRGASATTRTSSAREESDRVRSTTLVLLSLTSISRVFLPKPSRAARARYRPMGRKAIWKKPWLLVTVVRTWPVSVLRSSMLTPGTRPPCASFIVPSTVPLTV